MGDKVNSKIEASLPNTPSLAYELGWKEGIQHVIKRMKKVRDNDLMPATEKAQNRLKIANDVLDMLYDSTDVQTAMAKDHLLDP